MAWRSETFAMSFLLGSFAPVSGSVFFVRSLGFGRIVVSETEAPNMLANLVWIG